MDDKQLSLEDTVLQYGRALIVIDENGDRLQVVQPNGKKVDIDEDEDEYHSHGIELTENEKKSVAYLTQLDDESFDASYSDETNDDESAEELKVLFDVGFAFARRALTNRRKKKKRGFFGFGKGGQSEDIETKSVPCWNGYVQVGMKKGKKGKMVPNCVPEGQQKSFFLVEEETKSAKNKLKNPKGGLTAAGRAHFKRTEGANLKPGVKGAADTPEKMRRKGSFLTRFFTNPSGPMKDKNGKPTRLALSAAAWGEPVPQDSSDAAELAAKGRRMLERYNNVKKKDSWDEIEIKSLGPTIGGGGSNEDATRDQDGDGVINDGTENEKPTPKKNSNEFLERRTRKNVRRTLRDAGMTPTAKANERSKEERAAKQAARAEFDQEKDRRRFVRNELKKGGMTPTAKLNERSKEERAARQAARAEYDRRVRAGEPKKPQLGTPPVPRLKPIYPEGYEPNKPADRYPDPPRANRAEEERMERLRPKPRESRPADRYPDPPRANRAEEERMERLRPKPRESRPADRYPNPPSANRAEEERMERLRPRAVRPIPNPVKPAPGKNPSESTVKPIPNPVKPKPKPKPSIPLLEPLWSPKKNKP